MAACAEAARALAKCRWGDRVKSRKRGRSAGGSRQPRRKRQATERTMRMKRKRPDKDDEYDGPGKRRRK